MARLGQMTLTGAMVVLAVMLALSSHADRDESRSTSWGSSQAVMDPDPGFWRSHAGASAEGPRTYSAGMSHPSATSRVTVLPEIAAPPDLPTEGRLQ